MCAIYVLCVYNAVYLCFEVISIPVSLLIKSVFKKAFNYLSWYKEVISEYLVQLLVYLSYFNQRKTVLRSRKATARFKSSGKGSYKCFKIY